MDIKTELAPVLNYRGKVPDKLPYNVHRPTRFGAQFSSQFMAVMSAFSDGRYDIGDTELGAPEYNARQDILHMIPADRFNDTTAEWHALFHESAHRLQFIRHGWKALADRIQALHESPFIEMLTGIPSQARIFRARTEITADLAGWLARKRLQLPNDPAVIHMYTSNWGEVYKPVAIDFQVIDSIANGLTEAYNRVLK